MPNSRRIDNQSRRLICQELEANILVEAGAGSGKTHMLAERMAAGIATGVYQVEHMAAVTFTRKAASELRGRFHLALESKLAECRGRADSRGIERLQSALSNIERFFAGTIHSFCARLLRERPVEAGVSPGFTELDEVQDLYLHQRVWRDFITTARANGDSDMMALMDADIKPKDLDSAFATLCTNEDVEFPPGEADCPNPKPARKALDRFWAELQTHLPSTIDPETTCKIQGAALQYKSQIRVLRFRLDRPAVIATVLETWDRDSTIVQKWWAESPVEKRRLRDLVLKLHGDFHAGVVAPYLSQWRQYVYRLSIKLLTRARDSAAAERRRLNSLNYGDLLNLTARVLRENTTVRQALQEKFRYILVDEFQDTDPVQAEILFWLAGDRAVPPVNGQHRGTDWRSVTLRPGALFVVGDPKQSIYRFRRADIGIYNIVRQRFSDPGAGRVLPLTLNFRSVPQLCTWANEVFQTRFPSEPTAYAPRFAALDAERTENTMGGVFTLTHACDRNELQTQDAAKIAAYIRGEVDGGRRRFSDFMILTRKKRDRIAPYARALESLNIPVEVSGAGAFGDSPEVRALIVLLRALADPQDPVPLVASLRGPLFGISDPELFAFKQAGGWFSVFHETSTDSEAQSRADSALQALRQYYRWTRVLPAAAALDRILEHTGYLAIAATSPGGADAGNLLHAVDRVRRVMEEGGSLADAADALESDGDATSEVECLPLEPGRTDVVRLMNLHKAKGLEAKVVFLADPAGGPMSRVDVHIERTGIKAMGWLKIIRTSEGSFGGKLLGQHADWPAHELAEQPYLAAEQDRLLYVAATRAREMLVISRSTASLRFPAWSVLSNFLAQASELPIPTSIGIAPLVPLECGPATQTAAKDRQKLAHEVVSRPSWVATSVSAEARHIGRMTRFVEVRDDDPTKVVSPDTPSHRADAGQAWGTLVHGLLEHAMRHDNVSADDLKRLGAWLTVDEPQLRKVLDVAVKTVLGVAKFSFWREAKESDRSVETPFCYESTPGTILSGVIDLLFSRDGQWRIVDYKTDVALSTHLTAYQEQLKLYEGALAKVGVPTVTSGIQEVRDDDEGQC